MAYSTAIVHRIRSRYPRIFRGALTAIAISGFTGCGESVQIDTSILPPEQLFWSLTLNHKAVNLSTTAPYDTIRLVAVARNADGDLLPDAPPATFAPSSDLSVVVFPDGLVRGTTQTNTTGIRVVASLTYHGVTHMDTAFVVVTNTPSPPVMKSYAIDVQPGDSTRLPASLWLFDRRTKRLRFIANDSANVAIPRGIAFYTSSNTIVADVNRQTGVVTGNAPGTTTIRATSMMYGISRTDSLIVTVTDPMVAFFIMRSLSETKNMVIGRGGDIVWMNATGDSLDIVFDDSSAVQMGGASAYGLAARDRGGNIALFHSDSVVFPSFGQLNLAAARSRSFPNPGTYAFHSVRHPGIRGTIQVR